ncbi:MAG: diaminopimelate epimerase [Candidatus Aminicenantes bacterium]|nr:diaminopimelate epimerase [Candidatus Aminicenantes bacterium]
MIFYKTVSAGNDFIHIAADEIERVSRGSLAAAICERNGGAGADGVVFYKIRPDRGAVDFEIFNRDGSEAELSGNGMAGLSALLFYLGEFTQQVVLHTRSGRKNHELLARNENKFRLKIEIGEADFSRADFFPFLQENKVCYEHEGVTFYPVSVGNPHAVVIPGQQLSFEEITATGKRLESAPIFPQKTNVEFVLPAGKTSGMYENGADCPVFYYERGVGHTQSSSTGSAAVFAVLQRLGLVKNRLTIAAGSDKIKIYAEEKIYIENITKIVYKGIYMNRENRDQVVC